MRFINRREAGALLANKLASLEIERDNAIVIALPKGGVPVAHEVAKKLGLPMDIILVKKIGAPFNPELAIGAVSEDDEVFYNLDLLKYLGYGYSDVEPFKKRSLESLKENSTLLRQGRLPIPLENKEIVLVDDGIATGATIEVVIHLLRRKKVKRIIVATPVSSPDAVKKIEALVDKIITVVVPPTLRSVGQWYEDFNQVETDEVIDMLKESQLGNKLLIPIEVVVKDKDLSLSGHLYTTENIKSWVIFAHGSGSSHKSVRNNAVARELTKAGHGTLLFDLLTLDEDKNYSNRFNIPLLTKRLIMATKWLQNTQYYQQGMPIGYFGASTGSAAALGAAADTFIKDLTYAVISRGGRPDMVEKEILRTIDIPTLLIVGGNDVEVIKLNEKAQMYLSHSQIYIVPHATHLFEEPGALEEVTRVAINWYNDHLKEFLHERLRLSEPLREMDYLNP